MDNSTANRIYGTDAEVLTLIKDEFDERGRLGRSGQLMELMSRLSDVQEQLAMGRGEEARQDINIVKMLLDHLCRQERQAEMARYQ